MKKNIESMPNYEIHDDGKIFSEKRNKFLKTSLNNKGYLSIRNTQKNYFNNNIYGESEKTGLWFPDLKKIADAYEMEYYSVENNSTLKEFFERYLHSDKSIIFDVNCKFWQDVIPTLALKYDSVKNINVQTGLDDMFPFLNDDELN
jgi:acetolactate synthase-1/2/3 large subunit